MEGITSFSPISYGTDSDGSSLYGEDLNSEHCNDKSMPSILENDSGINNSSVGECLDSSVSIREVSITSEVKLTVCHCKGNIHIYTYILFFNFYLQHFF